MALVPSNGSSVTPGLGEKVLKGVLSGVFGFGLPVLKRLLLWYGNVVHKSLAITLNRQFGKYGEWIPTSSGYTFVPKPEYSDSLPDQTNTTRGDFDWKNIEKLSGPASKIAGWLWDNRRRPETGGHKVVPYSGPKIEEIDMYRPRPRVLRDDPPAGKKLPVKRPVAHLDHLMATGALPRKAPPRARSAASPSPAVAHQNLVSSLQTEHSVPAEQRLAKRAELIRQNQEAARIASEKAAAFKTTSMYKRPRGATIRRHDTDWSGQYGPRNYKILAGFGKSRRMRDIYNGRSHAVRSNPAAYGGSYVNRMGKLVEQGDGITFSKKEYIAPVTSKNAYTQTEYDINPGVAATFPFLNQLAKLFQEYIFTKLRFYVVPRVATTSSCGLFQALLTNVKTPAPTSAQEIMTITGATESVSWKPKSIRIGAEDLQLTGPTRAVRVGALNNEENADLFDVGRFFIARAGGDAALDDDVVGDLYVSYTIHLLNPIPDVLTLDAQPGLMTLVSHQDTDVTYSPPGTVIPLVNDVFNPDEGPNTDDTWNSSNTSTMYYTRQTGANPNYTNIRLPKGNYLFSWYAKINLVGTAYPIEFNTANWSVISGTATIALHSPSTAGLTVDGANDREYGGSFLISVAADALMECTPFIVAPGDINDFYTCCTMIDRDVFDNNFPTSWVPSASETLTSEEGKIRKTEKEVDELKDQVEALTKLVRGMKLIQDVPSKIPSGKKF